MLTVLAGYARAAPIGSPVIVVNNVTGKLGPVQQPKVLRVGVDVFSNETVITGNKSAARLVFLDKTMLEIGASSQVVLDRFVFNPDPTKSQVVLSIAKGALRFATGDLPHSAYTIHTPSATLGVRGTIFNLTVNQGQSCVFTENGAVVVTGGGKTVRVRAGESTCVPNGGTPARPAAGSQPSPAIFEMLALLAEASTPGGMTTTLFGNTAGVAPTTTSGCVSPSTGPGNGCSP